ncbi:MAG TPA: hypothetical protein PLS28_04380 [Clostridiales bacterium]|nr:hypothetical protein [Clostridiales bacterium]
MGTPVRFKKGRVHAEQGRTLVKRAEKRQEKSAEKRQKKQPEKEPPSLLKGFSRKKEKAENKTLQRERPEKGTSRTVQKEPRFFNKWQKYLRPRQCCGKQYGKKAAGIGALLGAPVGFLIGTILFQRIPMEVLLSLVGALLGAYAYPSYLIRKREALFRMQFCDFLESISTSLACGKNTYDTFLSAEEDMKALYPADAPICLAGAYIAGNLLAGEPLQKLLQQVAKESRCEDVETFGNIYVLCEQTGGNLKSMVDQSRIMLTEKLSIEAEIAVFLAGPKNELYFMTGMPLLILSAMKILSSELFSETVFWVNGFALALFTAAFLAGRKIVKIRV